jgi:NADP-dependent aldehyde dehydrogenase
VAAARGPEIAQGFVASMTLGAGQFCTKPGLLFLPAGHGMDAALAAAVDAVAPAPMLNARIRDQLASGRATLAAHPAVATVAAAGAAAPEQGAWSSAVLYRTSAQAVAHDPDTLAAEYFGPTAVLVEYDEPADLLAALREVGGALTATVHAEPGDAVLAAEIVAQLRHLAGRVVYNGWPTGVAVTPAMQHGGPWPASTDARYTSVGTAAIERWVRPVCYQDVPDALLPEGLRAADPWRLPRRVG